MKATFLNDRGVVKVSGEDARDFLNGIVTTDVTLVRPGLARFGALLTPQGKIIADFLLSEAPPGHGGGFLFDCARSLASTLAGRLQFYKLRAKVSVEDLSDTLGVLAVWDIATPVGLDLAYADPRDGRMGWRVLIPADLAAKAAALLGAEMVAPEDYMAHRIACAVPQGGLDFAYGDAFPHDANMDWLHGVDFDKGCYVGQEVVSRMKHRGTARTRIVPFRATGPAPEPGTAISSGERGIGTIGGAVNGQGLALVRTDRAAEALAEGAALVANGQTVTLELPKASA